MNIEKPPAGGRACGRIGYSPKSARLRFHCRTRNKAKGGEVESKWVFFFHYYLLKKINLSPTKMNSEKPPAGGEACG